MHSVSQQNGICWLTETYFLPEEWAMRGQRMVTVTRHLWHLALQPSAVRAERMSSVSRETRHCDLQPPTMRDASAGRLGGLLYHSGH